MTGWTQWWHGLTILNQLFFSGALFFSILFLWQMIGSLVGLIDVHDLDVGHPDGGFDHPDIGAAHDGLDGDSGATGAHDAQPDSSYGQTHDGHGSLADFKLLTVRSILACFTLFFWAGSLYMANDTALFWSFCYAALWGLVAMFSVALALYLLQRLTFIGTQNIASCVGTRGVVYLDIPADGQGEVRVLVSGAISCVKARSRQGQAISAGTPVRVVRALGAVTIEVEPAQEASALNESL